jgi:hypothetical protein
MAEEGVMSERKDWFLPVGIGVGVLLVAGGVALYFLRNPEPAPEPVGETAQPVADVVTPEPVAVPPLVTPPRTVPLPPLDDSDVDVLGGLTEIFGQQAVMQYLVPERIVRNIVVTIDNVPRQQLALNQRPIRPTPGVLVTAGADDTLVLAPANYARYEPFVTVASSVDAKTLVALYRGLQPLFQQAYEELGHPDASFNDRLVEVVEHLLATPNAPGEIRLVQPSVYYKYADERLEKLSAGQKLLLRMGPANAAAIKAKLRDIQAELL